MSVVIIAVVGLPVVLPWLSTGRADAVEREGRTSMGAPAKRICV